MLGDHPIHPVLLSRDLDAARGFYRDQLGLDILVERPNEAIEFRCGNTKLAVTLSSTGPSETQTKVAWVVKDLEAELAHLRDRGVQIEEYDMPGLKTDAGIAEFGFARFAWIVDPDGNTLAIEQMKE